MKPVKSPSARKKRRCYTAAALAAAAILALPPPTFAFTDVTVIYTGETHAMLGPCDCPGEPIGGLAERAAVLGEFGRDGRLLIDGGGFSGGGVYDTYSAGRAADSARTLKTIAAMGAMGYDAVAIGDDDLQYGGVWLVEQAMRAGVPLVCANCFTADGKHLVAPYIIVKKGGNTFAITAVTTPERLFPVDSTIIIKDPATVIEKVRKEMKRKSKNGQLVLISHLGEEETGALLKRSSGYLLAANAHRKLSVQPLTMLSGVPTLQFGFQGKRMALADLGWKNRRLQLLRSEWIDVDGAKGSDADVAAAISVATVSATMTAPPPSAPAGAPEGAPQTDGAAASQRASATPPSALLAEAKISQIPDSNKVYDLYIMSLCPYGTQALADLAELIRAFPQREWNVWFIGTADGDKLTSLRGEDEVFDEALWLGVRALYPFRYHEFLFLRASSKARTEALLDEMGLDAGKVRHWAEEMGQSELRQHYLRSMRLNINASPTLLINNNVYDRPMGGGRLVREECNAAIEKPAFCDDYPECFEDTDCRAKGKIGRCAKGDGAQGKSVCEFRDDAEFALTVLISESAHDSPEKQVIDLLEEMLPGARVSVVKLSSAEGQRIATTHTPAALPFFHFDKRVENAHRFMSLSDKLTASPQGGYMFKRGVVDENYYPLRADKPGLIELYADPMMPDIGKVIGALLSDPDLAKRVTLRPVLTKDPAGPMSAQERLRAEEALRWIIIAKEYPKKYHQYLKIYSENSASSYWFNWLQKIGINKNRFMKRVEANQPKQLVAYWEDFSQITAGEPVMVLIGNRTKVPVSNERDLVRVLKSIGF